MDKKSCILDHIQKTGGTAWAKYVETNFADRRVSPLILHEDIRFGTTVANDYDFVTGHFDLSPEYQWPSSIYHMTLIREPVDRFLSHYFYVRAAPNASEPFAQLARSHELDEILALGSQEVELYIRNFYARHFLHGMYPAQTVDELLAGDRFSPDEISRFVLDRYDLVGLTEHIDLAADCFCFHTHSIAKTGVPVERVTAKRPSVDDIAPGTLATLRRLSEADRDLYEGLRAGFFRTVRRIVISAAESGRAWRKRDPVPADPGPSGQSQACTLDGIDIFCPAFPVNDRAQCGERCTLSAVLSLVSPASRLVVYLTVRNHLLQVAFRDSTSIELASSADSNRVEVKWDFVCSLGEGTYDCDFKFVLLDDAHQPVCTEFAPSAYQFGVLAPEGASAAGLTWLAPTTTTAVGPAQPAPLAGEILVAERQIVARPAELLRIPVALRNAGGQPWSSSGLNRVVVGATIHPVGIAGNFDQASRHPFLHDPAPDETVMLELTMQAPTEPGDHVIWLGIVQERISWFCFDADGIALTVLPASDEGTFAGPASPA